MIQDVSVGRAGGSMAALFQLGSWSSHFAVKDRTAVLSSGGFCVLLKAGLFGLYPPSPEQMGIRGAAGGDTAAVACCLSNPDRHSTG